VKGKEKGRVGVALEPEEKGPYFLAGFQISTARFSEGSLEKNTD
jgi:hypothetical protein